MNKKSTLYFPALSILLSVLFLFCGCEIEESESGLTGSVFVSFAFSDGTPVEGARISVDGRETNQFTPDTVRNIEIGNRLITLSKPGLLDTSASVAVAFNQVSTLELTAEYAPISNVVLDNVPEGTVLLVNTIPFGVTPPQLFDSIGIGTFKLSAFLEGYATDLPAEWTVTLNAGDTAHISPTFTAVATGSQPDSLAPRFNLPDDLDSTFFGIADYRGKITFVTFFFNLCVPCYEEFPRIQAVYEDSEFAGKIQFFGIDSIDPWSVFRSYRNSHPELGLTFPLLHDRTHTAQTAYNVFGHPQNFLIDQTGVIRFRWASIATEAQLRDAVRNLLEETE